MTIPYKPGDFIGITTVSVNVGERNAAVRRIALRRLEVMSREVGHVQLAITQLRHALLVEKAPNSQRMLVDAVMNSRNWVLSLVISHCCIQRLFGDFKTTQPLSEMFGRAATDGVNNALLDPDYQAWARTQPS